MTLCEVLETRAADTPERLAVAFLAGEVETRLSYAELADKARSIAVFLAARGVLPGERALLLYPPGLDYVAAFFGCLYAGVIAVPAYPPKNDRQRLRVAQQQQDCAAAIVLEPSVTAALPTPRAWRPAALGAQHTAFLQYTSGSTGRPRGVVLSHANLLHNTHAISRAFATTPESHGVIWLPPYHDMGLIGGVLAPIVTGHPVTLMSPLAFVQSPRRWLEVIASRRATHSGGPSFAYGYSAQKVTPELQRTLDLSAWRVAFNGGEPIRRAAVDAFSTALRPTGFQPRAHFPCYGLAEATLMVSGAALTPGDGDAVSCGPGLPDQEIRIVDGEIWVKGPSVAQGYWQRPEETAVTFHATTADGAGRYLRTGDLGRLDGDKLVVTGRIKDLIIHDGKKHHPQDLEEVAELSHPALRSGSAAAFAIEDGTVLMLEVADRHAKDADAISAAARRAVAEAHDLRLHTISLVKPGVLPRTSSGKLQRYLCKALFEEARG